VVSFGLAAACFVSYMMISVWSSTAVSMEWMKYSDKPDITVLVALGFTFMMVSGLLSFINVVASCYEPPKPKTDFIPFVEIPPLPPENPEAAFERWWISWFGGSPNDTIATKEVAKQAFLYGYQKGSSK
jgi:hypothetical protein